MIDRSFELKDQFGLIFGTALWPPEQEERTRAVILKVVTIEDAIEQMERWHLGESFFVKQYHFRNLVGIRTNPFPFEDEQTVYELIFESMMLRTHLTEIEFLSADFCNVGQLPHYRERNL